MKAKAHQESLARRAIQNTSEWKARIEGEQLKLLKEATNQQREAWAKQLKEAAEAEQQERDVRVAKQLGKPQGTEK